MMYSLLVMLALLGVVFASPTCSNSSCGINPHYGNCASEGSESYCQCAYCSDFYYNVSVVDTEKRYKDGINKTVSGVHIDQDEGLECPCHGSGTKQCHSNVALKIGEVMVESGYFCECKWYYSGELCDEIVPLGLLIGLCVATAFLIIFALSCCVVCVKNARRPPQSPYWAEDGTPQEAHRTPPSERPASVEFPHIVLREPGTPVQPRVENGSRTSSFRPDGKENEAFTSDYGGL